MWVHPPSSPPPPQPVHRRDAPLAEARRAVEPGATIFWPFFRALGLVWRLPVAWWVVALLVVALDVAFWTQPDVPAGRGLGEARELVVRAILLLPLLLSMLTLPWMLIRFPLAELAGEPCEWRRAMRWAWTSLGRSIRFWVQVAFKVLGLLIVFGIPVALSITLLSLRAESAENEDPAKVIYAVLATLWPLFLRLRWPTAELRFVATGEPLSTALGTTYRETGSRLAYYVVPAFMAFLLADLIQGPELDSVSAREQLRQASWDPTPLGMTAVAMISALQIYLSMVYLLLWLSHDDPQALREPEAPRADPSVDVEPVIV